MIKPAGLLPSKEELVLASFCVQMESIIERHPCLHDIKSGSIIRCTFSGIRYGEVTLAWPVHGPTCGQITSPETPENGISLQDSL